MTLVVYQLLLTARLTIKQRHPPSFEEDRCAKVIGHELQAVSCRLNALLPGVVVSAKERMHELLRGSVSQCYGHPLPIFITARQPRAMQAHQSRLTAEIDDNLLPIEDSMTRVLRWWLQIVEIAREEFRQVCDGFPQIVVYAQTIATRALAPDDRSLCSTHSHLHERVRRMRRRIGLPDLTLRDLGESQTREMVREFGPLGKRLRSQRLSIHEISIIHICRQCSLD
jgi:hypothetical protein